MSLVINRRATRSTAYRGAVRSSHGSTAQTHEQKATTRGDPSDAIVFRRLVRGLIDARTADRQRHFGLVAERLRKSSDPLACVNILLEECALHSGPDGLEIGVDVLSHAGNAVLAAAERFVTADAKVRPRGHAPKLSRFCVHDDVWYMLLRGVARAEAPPLNKLSLIGRAIGQHQSPAVKSAGVYALGDLVESFKQFNLGPGLITSLLRLLKHHQDEAIREAAAAVVADLEG